MSIIRYQGGGPVGGADLPALIETCARIDAQLMQNFESLLILDALSRDYAANQGQYAETVGAWQRSKWIAETEKNLRVASDAWHGRREQEIDIARQQMQLDADRDPENQQHVLRQRLMETTDDRDFYKRLFDEAIKQRNELLAQIDQEPARERHLAGARPRPFARKTR